MRVKVLIKNQAWYFIISLERNFCAIIRCDGGSKIIDC
jgi:hypothetical protein